MNSKNRRQLSKLLALVLRHKPDDFGLQLEDDGWVKIDDLLIALQKHRTTRKDVEEVVEKQSKPRYEISGDKIRAKYGHSFDVELDPKEAEPPQILYHGTSRVNAEEILINGLKPMHRQYVHLSSDKETASSVGLRHDKNHIILIIRSSIAYQAGVKFYKADDLIWLADFIAHQFIEREGHWEVVKIISSPDIGDYILEIGTIHDRYSLHHTTGVNEIKILRELEGDYIEVLIEYNRNKILEVKKIINS